MKVTAVETLPVLAPLASPIGSALGTIHSFGCILVSVRTDAGITGENLTFTLNSRRTKVLRQMVDELADQVIGRDAGHIADFWARAWKDINFLGHKGVPVVGIWPGSDLREGERVGIAWSPTYETESKHLPGNEKRQTLVSLQATDVIRMLIFTWARLSVISRGDSCCSPTRRRGERLSC